MAIESSRPLMSYAEYLALPEGAYNLIEGHLIVTPAPTVRHQLLQGRLHFALFGWNRERRAGIVLTAPTDVVLRDGDPPLVVQPDVLFVARGGRASLTSGGVVGPPDLTVEIVSPGSLRLDGVKKRALYQAHGVKEFWLVLADLDQVEVLQLGEDGRFAPPRLLGVGDVLGSDLMPGFALPLADLFALEEGEADAW